jgi:hypothetical protein
LRPGVAAGLPLSVELKFVKPPVFLFRCSSLYSVNLLGRAVTLAALSATRRNNSRAERLTPTSRPRIRDQMVSSSHYQKSVNSLSFSSRVIFA